MLLVYAPLDPRQQADRYVGGKGQGTVVYDVVVGHIRRFESLALVPRGELRERPSGPPVVRRVRVCVIIDDRASSPSHPGVGHEPRNGAGQDHSGKHEQNHDGRPDRSPYRAALPGERRRPTLQRTPRAERQDPDGERPLRAGEAEERERVERGRERGEHDVEDRPIEIGDARHRAGDGVDERGQRMNRSDEQQEQQRDGNRVAAQQVHSQIPRMSSRVEASSRRLRTR